MSRLLVTGARGLLGSTLVPCLRAHGHSVVTCSRTGADQRADLSDAAQVDAVMEAVAPEVIINLAANTSVDDCETNPQRAFLGNVRIVENLARSLRHSASTAHLIHLSTDQVYDGPGPHVETDVTITNTYGLSKYAGELAAAAAGATILRTNMFGRSQSPDRVSLTDWLFGALRRGEQITVFDDVLFSPLSLQRLSAMIQLAIVQRPAGIYNVGSSDGMSKADFAFHFAHVIGLPTTSMRRGRMADVTLRARRPSDMRLDSSRFEQTFAERLPTLQEELDDTRADYASEDR